MRVKCENYKTKEYCNGGKSLVNLFVTSVVIELMFWSFFGDLDLVLLGTCEVFLGLDGCLCWPLKAN